MSNQRQRLALNLLGGFFIIMIVLTVLSRMADSITIPNVTVASPKSGKLEHTIEVSGQLEAKDKIDLAASSGLQIKEVRAEKGDRVKSGDVLIELDTKEVEDKLMQAEIDLKKIGLQMQQLALDSPLEDSEDLIGDAELSLKRMEEDRRAISGEEDSKIKRAEEDLELAEEDLKLAKDKLELLKNKNQEEQLKKAEEEVTVAKKSLEDKKYERDKALKNAKMAIDDAYAQYNNITTGPTYTVDQALDRAKKQYAMVEDDWKRIIKQVEEELAKKETTLKKIKDGEIDEEAIKGEEENIRTAERAVEAKAKSLSDLIGSKDGQITKVDRMLEDAKRQLAKARDKEVKGELTKENKQLQVSLQKSLLELEKEMKLKEVKEFKEIQASGGVIKAPADGIVMAVKAEKGSSTTGGNLVSMVASDAQYQFVAEISDEQAKYLEIGDEVVITLDGEKQKLANTFVENIVNMPSETGTKKEVSVTLTEGEPGMKAKMKVAKETSKYSNIIQLEALREDSKGKYVLVVREQITTLGVQMVAERVDVIEVEKNQTSVAVQAALSPKDQIIVKSNKPIMTGDRVRLKQ